MPCTCLEPVGANLNPARTRLCLACDPAPRQLFAGSAGLDSQVIINSKRGFADLHPPPRPSPDATRPFLDEADPRGAGAALGRPLASFSQPLHSAEAIRTTLVSLRQAVTRRSSIVTRPSARASRSALRTKVSDTPASAARWPTANRQSPRRQASAATTDSTAISPGVNRAPPGPAEAAQRPPSGADARGSHPSSPAAHGLPEGRSGHGRGRITFLVSMRADSSSASVSLTWPAP